MQGTILTWARPRQRSPSPRDLAAARKRRVELAKSIDLPWPRGTAKVGRPSLQWHWDEALRSALLRDALPPGITRAVPAGWQRGDPLVEPAHPLLEDQGHKCARLSKIKQTK